MANDVTVTVKTGDAGILFPLGLQREITRIKINYKTNSSKRCITITNSVIKCLNASKHLTVFNGKYLNTFERQVFEAASYLNTLNRYLVLTL